MNKLFSKIAVFAVGAAMAVGVGVAASRDFARADAVDHLFAICDFTEKTASHSNYYQEWTYGDFKVFGGANNGGNWGYVKFGQKYDSKNNPTGTTNAYVKTVSPLANAISRVDMVLLASTIATDKVTSATWSLEVSSDAEFTSPTVVSGGDIDWRTAGTISINAGATPWAANSYYKIKIDIVLPNTSTNNGIVWVESIQFIEDIEEQDLDHIELADASLYSGKQFQTTVVPKPDGASLPDDLVYESGDDSIFTVSETGLITASSSNHGTTTLTVTSTSDPTITVTADVTVNACPTNISVGEKYILVAEYEDESTEPSTTKHVELTGINTAGANPYGSIAEYASEPAGTYELTVVAGVAEGTVGLKHGDDYLAFSGTANALKSKTTLDAESSWVVVTDTDDDSITTYASFGTDSARRLRFNPNKSTNPISYSPRFACYTSAQTALKLHSASPAIAVASDKASIAKGETATITTTILNGATGTPNYAADPATAVTLTPNGLTCEVTAGSVENSTPVTVTVSLAGCVDKEIIITVLPDAAIESIAVTTLPTKLAYYTGDQVDLTGLVVTATYDNTTQEVISNDLLDVEYDFSTAGQKDVTLKLKADETISTTFQVTVTEIEELTFATAVTYMSGLDTPTTAEGTNYYPANCEAAAATIFDVVGFVSGKRSSNNGKTVYISDTIEHAEAQENEIQAYHITISDEDYASLTVGSEVKIRGKLAVFSTDKTMEIMESSITIINIRPIVPLVKTVAESLTMIKAITPPENNKTAYVSSWQTYQVDGYVVEVYDTNRTLKILDSADGTSSEKLEVTFIEQSLYDSLKTIGTKIRAVGLLAWYKNNSGASRYQLANYTSVVELEPAPVVTPIDVNVAGALDALKDVTPANPVAMLSNTQTYAVTGYVKNLVGWSDTYKNGNIYMVDSSDGTGTAEVQAYHVGGYDTEDEFKAAFVKGTKIKVTGLLGAFLKNDGGTTYEIVNPVVEILQPPVVKPTSLTYEGTLTKTEYEIGEDFDTTLAGITKFIVTYSDDTQTNPHKVEKELSALNVDTSAFDKTTAGDYTIKVSYTEEGETVFFLLAVEVKGEEPGPGPQPVEPTLESISVVNEQTDYFVGETFNFSALSVTLVFDDESTEAGVLGTNYTLVYPQGFNGTFTEAGTFVFTVKAVEDETVTASFTVTVSNVPVVLDHITATCTVTEYTVGDQISADTLTVTAYFSDGSSQVITTGYTVTFDSSVAGENVKVTVSYTSEGVTKSASFYVTVKNAPAKKGCGGDIAATSIILSTLSLAGVALLALKKRKED